MTDQELARALFDAGLLTQDQVQQAAAQRTPERNFAQVVVGLGWVTPQQIAQYDPNALPFAAAPPMAPLDAPPPFPAAPPYASQMPPQASPPPAPPWAGAPAPGYNAPFGNPAYAGGVPPRPTEVRISAIGDAWTLLTSNLGTWVGTMFIFFIVIYGAQVPFSLMSAGAQTQIDPNNPFGPALGANLGITLISSAVSTVITAFLWAGLTKMALNQVDGKPVGVGDLFSGGMAFGHCLLAWFLFYLAFAVGILLCCVPGLAFASGMLFMFFLIVDKQMDAITAMKTSWETLRPVLMSSFLFVVVCYLASFIGIIGLCIGVVVTYPLLFLAPAIVYRDFFPAPRGGQEAVPNQPPPPIPSPF